MKAIIAAAMTPLALAGCVAAIPAVPARYEFYQFAQVIRAEQDFAALAARDGQWTAFRATATPDALMFVPQPVNAQRWLAGRVDPRRSVTWQPHHVYIACDGLTAATTGAAQWPGGGHGRFITIWRMQDDGSWKWIVDQGGPVAQQLIAPPQPITRAARCARRMPLSQQPPLQHDAGDAFGGGRSQDGSLSWMWVVRPDGSLRFVVDLEDNSLTDRVVDDISAGE